MSGKLRRLGFLKTPFFVRFDKYAFTNDVSFLQKSKAKIYGDKKKTFLAKLSKLSFEKECF